MREILYDDIVKGIKKLCIEANYHLPEDTCFLINNSFEKESSETGKEIIKNIIENGDISSTKQIPICQDTGLAVFFVEIGTDVKITGKSSLLSDAINEGTEEGYKEGYLRMSVVNDPVFERKNTLKNTPAIIHIELVEGNNLTVFYGPKGAGSENMSAVKMLNPSDGKAGIIEFVLQTIIKAGGSPCPPIIIGIGIGGTMEKAAILAKKALFRDLRFSNSDKRYADLEKEILEKINKTGIGPQGLGGNITALTVNIEYFPCHIASLPVAVNINCHAHRHKFIKF